MKIYNRYVTNEIFKNLINNIFSKYSKVSSGHKFLNSFWLVEQISNKLESYLDNSKTTKINNIVKLFNFTELILKKEIDNKYININNKILLGLIEKMIDEMKLLKIKSDNKAIDKKDLKILFEVSCDLLKYKEEYCEDSFKKLKWIYNNWTISSIEDIDSINDSIYHFISTRLMWGWSWKHMMKVFFRFSKHNNFWQLDFIEIALTLQTKHKRTNYSVFIPLDIERVENNEMWIKNFNLYNDKIKIIHSDDVEENINEKNAKNLQNLKIDKYYIYYKTEQYDEFSAIYEGIKRIIPTKLGIISALESHIKISFDCKIIVLSQIDKKQWFNSYELDNIENYNIFSKDFILVPELKLETITKYNSTKLLSNIFASIYNNEDSKVSESKYMSTNLLLETSTSFVKSLNFKTDPHITLINIAMVDFIIQFYTNNAFVIEKDFMDVCGKHTNNIINNDLKYLEFYLNHKECYLKQKTIMNDENNSTSFFSEWTNKTIFPNDNELKIIRESLKYFKDIAAQTRNKIMHEGKKTNFFDHLIIETLDSILTLSILRIVNKKIKSDIHVQNQWEWVKKGIKEKDFEMLKKVI